MDYGFFECIVLAETDDNEKGLFRVYGKGDPGYKVTSKLVSESALTLLHSLDKLPGGKEYGGVLTPASGLGEALIERLMRAEITFEVINF